MSFERMPTFTNSPERKRRDIAASKAGKRERSEKPSFKRMPYAEYVKREAAKRGLIEKKGYMVNPITREIDRGHVCEESLLGKCKIGRKEKVPVPTRKTPEDYEKVKNALFDFARQHQPAEKDKSEQNVSREAELVLIQKLKQANLNISEVNFYTAVGTPLDYQCGIDGWVEIVREDGDRENVSFDLKTGGYKDSKIQADILLRLDVYEDGFTPEEKVKELNNFANKVVNTYQG
ncbi:hypothetical protein ACFL08_00595 [Patescibacteria group bacterium]